MDDNTLAEIEKFAKSMSCPEETQKEELLAVIEGSDKATMKKAFSAMDEKQQALVIEVLEKGRGKDKKPRKRKGRGMGDFGRDKGVSSGDDGESVQGMKVRDAKEAKDKGDKKEAQNLIESAKENAKQNLKELKEMKKPKLAKSEEIMEDTKQEETVEKAVKMDDVAHPEAAAMSEKVMVGKIDQKKEQDEEDEKMVSSKKEAAEVRHQGGSGDDGAWEGQVIKSDQDYLKETLVLAKSMGISKEKLKEAVVLAKGDFNVIRAILEKGKQGACSRMDDEMKKKSKERKPESGDPEETADEMKAKVPEKVKKSESPINWASPNAKLEVSTKRGQNAHYTVEEGLIKSEVERTDRLSKSKFNYDHEEKIEKSRGKYSINEMLEKGMDESETQALQKSRKQDPSGAYTVSSFDVMQIAKDMNITEEEANELLGLKKSGEMEPYPEKEGEKMEKKSDKKEAKKEDCEDDKKKKMMRKKTVAMGVRG